MAPNSSVWWFWWFCCNSFHLPFEELLPEMKTGKPCQRSLEKENDQKDEWQCHWIGDEKWLKWEPVCCVILDQFWWHSWYESRSGEDYCEPHSLVSFVVDHFVERNIGLILIVKVYLRVLCNHFPQVSGWQNLFCCSDLLSAVGNLVCDLDCRRQLALGKVLSRLMTVGVASFNTPVITTFVWPAVHLRFSPTCSSRVTISWLCSPPTSWTMTLSSASENINLTLDVQL